MQSNHTPRGEFAQRIDPNEYADDDVDLDHATDPKLAWRDFERCWSQYKRHPGDLAWRRVYTARHWLEVDLDDKAALREMWALAKAGDPDFAALIEYGKERTKRYQRSAKGRASQKRSNAKRDPEKWRQQKRESAARRRAEKKGTL